MANAAIAYVNLADAGMARASSQEILLPSSSLLTPHIEERWRSRSSSDYVIADLVSAQSLDTILLRGMTASDSATVRVRISAVDSSAETSLLYDSGTLASGSSSFDAAYGALLVLLGAPVVGRYVRIDIADPGATYVEAGRIVIAVRTAFTYNFAPGAQVGWVDRSVSEETDGGQTLIWRNNAYRIVDLNFEWVSETQRFNLVELIDRVNGQHAEVLMILDTGSSNLARDAIWGLVSDLTPVSMLNLLGSDGAIYGKQYRIKERL